MQLGFSFFQFALVKCTILLSLSIFSSTALAASNNICDQAAAVASRESGVPLSVLRAVTRTETGRKRGTQLEPWPWSVNVEGKGSWIPTRLGAENFAAAKLSAGTRNMDIGCFQLNYRWHGHAFSSISEMFEPVSNARYAARFLTELFEEKGDWTNAVGAFHSRTQEFSDRYKKKYSAIYAELNGTSRSSSLGSLQSAEWNQFPLLKPSTAKPRRGSLVPLANDSGRGSLFSQNGGI